MISIESKGHRPHGRRVCIRATVGGAALAGMAPTGGWGEPGGGRYTELMPIEPLPACAALLPLRCREPIRGEAVR